MIYHGPQVVLPSAIQCSALLFWSLACIVVTKPTEWSSRHCYFCTLDFLIIVLLCPVFSGLVRPFLWEAVIHTCDGPGFCNVWYDWITIYSIGLGLAGLNSSVCTYCPHFWRISLLYQSQLCMAVQAVVQAVGQSNKKGQILTPPPQLHFDKTCNLVLPPEGYPTRKICFRSNHVGGVGHSMVSFFVSIHSSLFFSSMRGRQQLSCPVFILFLITSACAPVRAQNASLC